MKQRLMLLMLCALLLLAGCNAAPSFSPASTAAVPSVKAEETESATGFPSPAPSVFDEALIRDCYADVSVLPAPITQTAAVLAVDDRTLTLEDSLDNVLEEMVYTIYRAETKGDFTPVLAMLGENEALESAVVNSEENFQAGIYMASCTIHSLNTWSYQDLLNAPSDYMDSVAACIEDYALESCVLVQADLSWVLSDAAQSQGVQTDDGRYSRSFLFGRTADAESFLWYEVLWDEILV